MLGKTSWYSIDIIGNFALLQEISLLSLASFCQSRAINYAKHIWCLCVLIGTERSKRRTEEGGREEKEGRWEEAVVRITQRSREEGAGSRKEVFTAGDLQLRATVSNLISDLRRQQFQGKNKCCLFPCYLGKVFLFFYFFLFANYLQPSISGYQLVFPLSISSHSYYL